MSEFLHPEEAWFKERFRTPLLQNKLETPEGYAEAELNLAVQFYRSVAASQSIGALTGHSLGGALTRPCRRPASDARRGAA